MSSKLRKTDLSISAIILAAGESKRMGTPKQLLKIGGRSLLEAAVHAALDSSCISVSVVLGANIERLKSELYGFDVEIVFNADWASGMGGSISSGLSHLLLKNSALDGVIISVCDQPFLTSEIFDGLIQKYAETKSPIVASEYDNTLGVPALFDKKLFPDLLNLSGKNGAKQLIEKFESQTVAHPFQNGGIDIDTPEDFARSL